MAVTEHMKESLPISHSFLTDHRRHREAAGKHMKRPFPLTLIIVWMAVLPALWLPVRFVFEIPIISFLSLPSFAAAAFFVAYYYGIFGRIAIMKKDALRWVLLLLSIVTIFDAVSISIMLNAFSIGSILINIISVSWLVSNRKIFSG